MKWRKVYRSVPGECTCGYLWKYNGKRRYHGKKQRTWSRWIPGVSELWTEWSEKEFGYSWSDCYYTLKNRAGGTHERA